MIMFNPGLEQITMIVTLERGGAFTERDVALVARRCTPLPPDRAADLYRWLRSTGVEIARGQ